MKHIETNIEIEINPSELIDTLEKFKKTCEGYNSSEIAHKIVDSQDQTGIVRSFYKISPDIRLTVTWRPKYEGYKLVNL